MNFDRKPIEKTGMEKTIEDLMDKYEQQFGEPFVFSVGFPMSDEETVDAIKFCIESNKKQQLPKYEPNVIY